MRTINASKFKTECLAILDDVAENGEEVLILKRGKPVARLVAPVPEQTPYPQMTLRGTARILGDIVEPPLPADAWDANRGKFP